MDLLPFFLVLLTSVLFSLAFRRFHLPWVVALITAGVVIGPFGLELIEGNPTLDFFSEIGLIFLMFMAGLETRFDSFRELKTEILTISFFNGAIPLVAGVTLGYLLDFSLIPSLLLGIIFMSSSIAVIIPTLEHLELAHNKLGRTIISSTIVVDVVSLVLLSILLQSIDPITPLPLPSFYFILTIIIIAFMYGLPRIRNLIPRRRDEKDLFESEVRIIFALMIGVVVTFELLGLHPIIAGFFAGLALSESIKSDILLDKLRTISYGLFIPVFFIAIGMETDIGAFNDGVTLVGIILAVVLTSISSKFLSGWVSGLFLGFKHQQASLIGFATIPQLSTTLAVVDTAVKLNLLDASIIVAMVILSIITTLVAPIGIRVVASRLQ
jgi:Kef-type K+ transport system membrane component KefB